ncbi:glycosyltransferase [Magnaporthiopsis poae ATCC 64411]|uniref:Glycosyltransferase n=1 Tax=Magnaporthiopsis poae (strain ATCC 64411 / 73-15) TaxID=644358 RepID=A0A0C4DV04_MAGP6|nr:glycosyltransferase [Magnaporthiopsis poae ATCC 64411]
MTERSTEDSTAAPPRTRPLRFLINTFSATGHVLPVQAVVQELVRHGLLTPTGQFPKVYLQGDRTQTWRLCLNKCKSPLGTSFHVDSERPHIGRLVYNHLKGHAPRRFSSCYLQPLHIWTLSLLLLSQCPAGWRPDYVLNDAMPQGVAALAELGEIPTPYATLGVVPLYIPDVDPEGSPVAHPARSVLGKLLSTPRLALPVVNPQRARLGLPPLGIRDAASCPSLEHCVAGVEPTLFPGAKQQPRVHFVGPLVSRPIATTTNSSSPDLPAWWDEMCAHDCVVGITQGTYAVDPTALIFPAIRALRDDKKILMVVVHKRAEELLTEFDGGSSSGAPLENVRFAPWIPYDMLLPRCRALVTNGGYGSVTQALSHGVPLVCAGASEDKQDTAARVVAVGAGLDLETDRPSVEQVREAVSLVVNRQSYRERAIAIGEELNGLGGAGKACDLLVRAAEGLVAADSTR